MLIAPIFHNSYLSPKHPESQKTINNAVSSSSGSVLRSDTSNSNKSNIFKTAFNRSISFFSKITSSSGSPSTSSSSKPADCSEANNDSSSDSSASGCSSPDSLKTEMIFFKPISREPKTSSSTKPVLLRIPSIRSTASSNENYINSPCPSPFFIPITPRRESAFSLVVFHDDDNKDSKLVKPKATKRRPSKPSPKKPPPKRSKKEEKSPAKSKPEPVVTKSKAGAKTVAAPAKRKTRSMDKNETEDGERRPAPVSKKQMTDKKNLDKPQGKKAANISTNKKNDSAVETKQPTRVTRSSSFRQVL